MSVADAEAKLKQAMAAMLQASCPPVTDHRGRPWSTHAINALQDTVSRAHTLLDDAARQAAAQANAYTAINRLPAELLCMVFAFYLDGTNHFCNALRPLMLVCRHWHRTAASHAALWTKFTIFFGVPQEMSSALSTLSACLARAKNAPVDLAITVARRRTIPSANDCMPDLDESQEPLQAHMGHMRSLRIETNAASIFHSLWRVALSMPAPHLRSLALAVTRNVPLEFPADMFSGCAPLLEEITLDDVTLPPPDWPPLRGLRRFAYHNRDSVDLRQFVRFLHRCPNLASVSLQCSGLQLDSPPSGPVHGAPPAPGNVHITIMQYLPHTPALVLSMPWATLPAHLSLTVRKTIQTLNWVDSFVTNPRTLSFCVNRVSMHSRTTTTVCGTDALGNTRTLHATGSVQLDDLAPYFASLAELTLSEVHWPGLTALPSIPNLDLLVIDLMDPVAAANRLTRYSSVGVFLLDIDPSQSYVWRFAQLRTVRLSYRASSGRSKAEYVVSAHEVRLFFRWHLQSDLPLRLVLNNVYLLEDMSDRATKSLLEIVQSISVMPVDAASSSASED